MKPDDAAPAPLHAMARELLADFRAREDMPAEARARVRRRLLDAGDDAPRREAVAHGGVRSWIAWSLVGAAAGVALLLGLKAVAPMLSVQGEPKSHEAAPDRVEREEATSRASIRDAKPTRTRAAREVEPLSPPEIATPPVPESPAQPPTSSVRRAATPSRERSTEPASAPAIEPTPVAPAASTLDAERRLVAQAWSALAEGDPGAALASAAAHRERFANGVLAPERLAVEAIAHCKRDGDEGRARAFLQAHARSPLAARVRTACALDDARAGSTDARTPTGR